MYIAKHARPYASHIKCARMEVVVSFITHQGIMLCIHWNYDRCRKTTYKKLHRVYRMAPLYICLTRSKKKKRRVVYNMDRQLKKRKNKCGMSGPLHLTHAVGQVTSLIRPPRSCKEYVRGIEFLLSDTTKSTETRSMGCRPQRLFYSTSGPNRTGRIPLM